MAHAQTPDGDTPAVEQICDPLKGGTPGLYGLCVAYCEAQDADTCTEEDEFAGCRPPPRRILENYERKMGEGDPPMPCVGTPCPCDMGQYDHFPQDSVLHWRCFGWADPLGRYGWIARLPGGEESFLVLVGLLDEPGCVGHDGMSGQESRSLRVSDEEMAACEDVIRSASPPFDENGSCQSQ
ncbi:MAG: hypothetical protein JRI25_02635 [Deltaproteobacteria bacterium]|nr:hypothetical protein [Deltaproteobacteria bacterium]